MAEKKQSPGLGDIGTSYAKAAPYVDASWQLIGGVALCTFLGLWLDKKFGTSPWLVIVGVFLGFASGMLGFWRAIQQAERKKIAQKKDQP